MALFERREFLDSTSEGPLFLFHNLANAAMVATLYSKRYHSASALSRNTIISFQLLDVSRGFVVSDRLEFAGACCGEEQLICEGQRMVQVNALGLSRFISG